MRAEIKFDRGLRFVEEVKGQNKIKNEYLAFEC